MTRAITWVRLIWVGLKWTASGECLNGRFSRWAIFRQAIRFANEGARQR